MGEEVNEKVDVITISKKGRGIVVPIKIKRNNKVYTIQKIGLQHPVREGRTLVHVFECTDGATFFRLRFNTETLQWVLEATWDGNST